MYINQSYHYTGAFHKFYPPVSHEINLKCVAAMSHLSNITDLTVSMHTITNGMKILMNPVSAAGDMRLDSFHCYLLHLASLVVSEQRPILTGVCNNL